MSDERSESPNEQPDSAEGQPAGPLRQVYFVTVEWLDAPHRPIAPERLARAVRHAVEHGHNPPAGSPPARFVVRVKGDDLAVELEGRVEHHHHEPA